MECCEKGVPCGGRPACTAPEVRLPRRSSLCQSTYVESFLEDCSTAVRALGAAGGADAVAGGAAEGAVNECACGAKRINECSCSAPRCRWGPLARITGMAVKTDATRTEATIQACQKATLVPSLPPTYRSNPDLTKRVRLFAAGGPRSRRGFGASVLSYPFTPLA